MFRFWFTVLRLRKTKRGQAERKRRRRSVAVPSRSVGLCYLLVGGGVTL
jgi:hypothetical protein